MKRNAASEAQLRAAEPTASTWLSANAGSGKTRVLTDRVARLLLRGTEPHKILCLTYTKAAAAEMQNRLLERLGTWAMLPEEALRKELWLLGEEGDISAENLREARRLFAKAQLNEQEVRLLRGILADAQRMARLAGGGGSGSLS